MANLEWPSGERCWRSFSFKNFEKPPGEGDRKIKRGGLFKLYFKGIVSYERFGLDNEFTDLAGFGVAIFDGRDKVFKEIYEPLNANALSEEEAYLTALIEGLDAAINSGIERLVVFCDSMPVILLLTRKLAAEKQKTADLLTQAWERKRKIRDCPLTRVSHNDVNRAFKYAREMVFLQILVMSVGEENCDICGVATGSENFYAVEGCLHRFCKDCIKDHVEETMRKVNVPMCPDEECMCYVSAESCKEFFIT